MAATPSPLRVRLLPRVWGFPASIIPERPPRVRALSYSCWCFPRSLRSPRSVSLRVPSRGPPPRFGGRGGAPAPSPPSPLPRRSLLSLQAVAPLATLGLRSLRSLGRAVSRLRRVPVRSPRPASLRYASLRVAGRTLPSVALARPRRSRGVCVLAPLALPPPRGCPLASLRSLQPCQCSLRSQWHGFRFPCSASLSSLRSSAPRVPLGARSRRSPLRGVSSRPSVGLRLSLGRGACLAWLDIHDPRRDVRGGASQCSSGWFRAHRWRPFIGFCYHHLFISISFGACAPNPKKGVASPASRGMPMLNER